MLQRGNPYGMHSHAGAWERENATEYKAIVEKLGPKLNAFINR
jgi:hypothetical protein